jgi:hypothetical protein
MRNSSKRRNRHQRTLLEQAPRDRVNPPPEDERRGKWTSWLHAGDQPRKRPGTAGRGAKPRSHLF